MESKPLPRINRDSVPFWEGCAAGELRVQQCGACGLRQLPPRGRCLACGATELQWRATALRGEVHSYTVVHRAPSAAFRADVPYVIALIDLGEVGDRARLMVNVVDCDPNAVSIGMSVSIGFERRREGDLEVTLPVARIERRD